MKIIPLLVLAIVACSARPAPAPAPVFVDLSRVFLESSPGKAAAAEFQQANAQRQQQYQIAAAEAAKLAEGSKERQAKEQRAQAVLQRMQQEQQAQGEAMDRAFRDRVIALATRLYPGRIVLPIVPLVGGENITEEIKTRLDAANEDAEQKLKAKTAEVEQLRKQLADRPAAAPPPALAAKLKP